MHVGDLNLLDFAREEAQSSACPWVVLAKATLREQRDLFPSELRRDQRLSLVEAMGNQF